MILEIRNTTDHQVVFLAPVQDAESSRLNYMVEVTLPEGIQDGEYEYTLRDESTILSTGLMTIGGYDVERKEYNEPVTIKQYGK